MKIGELLELTQTKKLSDIAKESLDFGEKKAVEALKKAGCYAISGKRGWYFEGDEAVLEKSVYDFVPAGKRKAKVVKSDIHTGKKAGMGTSYKAGGNAGQEQAFKEVATGVETAFNTSTNVSTDADINIETGSSNGVNTGTSTGTGKGTSASRGKVTGLNTREETGTKAGDGTDVLDRLFAGLPATNDKKEVSFYLTQDVIGVINRAKKGNRSDLVNEALRKVFREKGWL